MLAEPSHFLRPSLAQNRFWDILFWPYQYLELSSLYDHYQGLIDMTIYVLIFVGAAQVTLGQRFPGNGGRAISIGTGLS